MPTEERHVIILAGIGIAYKQVLLLSGCFAVVFVVVWMLSGLTIAGGQAIFTLFLDLSTKGPMLSYRKGPEAHLRSETMYQAQAWKSNSRQRFAERRKGTSQPIMVVFQDYSRVKRGDRILSRPRYPDVGKGAS